MNIAVAVTAPVLAAVVNSPILLGKKLWSETRIALFERSVDTGSLIKRTGFAVSLTEAMGRVIRSRVIQGGY